MDMDLVDRYLQAVKMWLPSRQRNDIVAELGEDIRSEIDEKEADLGRKLNEDELVALIQRRGQPIVVAGRYRNQGSLIGPTLFPIYTLILRIAAIPFVMTWVVRFGLRLSHLLASGASPVAWLTHTSTEFWTSAVALFGVVTVVFAILERVERKTHFLENWNPRDLKPVRTEKRASRVSSLTELALQIAFALWWIRPSAFFDVEWHGTPWSVGQTWAVLHGAFFVPVLLLMLVMAAIAFAQFLHPRETFLRSCVRAGAHWATAFIAALIVAEGWTRVMGEWHSLHGVNHATVGTAAATTLMDVSIYTMVSWIGIATSIAFVVEVVRIIRARRKGDAGVTVSQSPEVLCI